MQTFLSPLPSSRTPGMTPSLASSPGPPATSPIAGVSPVSPTLTPSAIQTPGQALPWGTQPVADLPTMLFSPQPAPVPARRRRRGLYIALAVILIVVLLAASLAAFYTRSQHGGTTAQNPVAGHAYFVSSGLLSLNSSQGITDELQIHLQGIPDPQPGNSYYAWLLTDKSLSYVPTLLGTLQPTLHLIPTRGATMPSSPLYPTRQIQPITIACSITCATCLHKIPSSKRQV